MFPRGGRKKQGSTLPVDVMTVEIIGALQSTCGKFVPVCAASK
jgi:hypothetical protein